MPQVSFASLFGGSSANTTRARVVLHKLRDGTYKLSTSRGSTEYALIDLNACDMNTYIEMRAKVEYIAGVSNVDTQITAEITCFNEHSFKVVLSPWEYQSLCRIDTYFWTICRDCPGVVLDIDVQLNGRAPEPMTATPVAPGTHVRLVHQETHVPDDTVRLLQEEIAALKAPKPGQTHICSICMEHASNRIIPTCGHTMCDTCVPGVRNTCPFCRTPFDKVITIYF